MIVSLYTSRVLLNALGVDDFGIYNVVGGIVVMFTFINSAMSSSTQRYLTFELGRNDKEKLKTVFNTSFQIHSIISLLVLVLGETVGLWFFYTQMNIPADRMNAAFWVYQFSILSTMIMMTNIPYHSLIIAHEKMSYFAYVSIIDVILKLLVVFVIIYTPLDKLIFYSFLIVVTTLINRMLYQIYCNKKFNESKLSKQFDKSLFKEMTNFAGWNLFGNLAGVTFTQGVNILLNIFFGPAVNAARGVAIQVQSAVSGFVTNFQTALNPQITKTYSTNDLNQMHNLIFKSSKYSFFLLFLLSMPIILRTEQILILWLKIVPEHTANFVRLVLLISLIDSVANPLMTSAAATGKVKLYQGIVGSLLLLILPFSYFALKLGFQPESVFLVHLFIAILAQLSRLIIIKPMISLSLREYAFKVIKPIFIISLITIIPLYFINNYFGNGIINLILIAVISVIFVGIVILSFGLTKSERNFILSNLKSRLKL